MLFFILLRNQYVVLSDDNSICSLWNLLPFAKKKHYPLPKKYISWHAKQGCHSALFETVSKKRNGLSTSSLLLKRLLTLSLTILLKKNIAFFISETIWSSKCFGIWQPCHKLYSQPPWEKVYRGALSGKMEKGKIPNIINANIGNKKRKWI